jgi:hypothetical protein
MIGIGKAPQSLREFDIGGAYVRDVEMLSGKLYERECKTGSTTQWLNMPRSCINDPGSMKLSGQTIFRKSDSVGE